jgi:hypothetical protein
VPVFVETGADLIRHFELDSFRLEAIINEGVDKSRRVAHDDIALLAVAGSQQPYALLRLRASNGGRHAAGVDVVSGAPASIEALRQHLYDKYVFAHDGEGRHSSSDEADGTDIAAKVFAVS